MATFDIATLRKITLLYVEDEPDLREVESAVYKKIFKTLLEAKNGLEALELFKQHQNEIDVIITDINMPKMDGLTLTKEIKKISNIPIIITSAHSDPKYTTQAIELGVKKYLKQF
jgi:YesN/AraC family two-component response regulator